MSTEARVVAAPSVGAGRGGVQSALGQELGDGRRWGPQTAPPALLLGARAPAPSHGGADGPPPRGTLHGDAPDRVAMEGRALGPTARWPLSSQWLQIPKAHPFCPSLLPTLTRRPRHGAQGNPCPVHLPLWPQPPPGPAAWDSFIHNLRQLPSPPHGPSGQALPSTPSLCISDPDNTLALVIPNSSCSGLGNGVFFYY